jgi:hypothetical protein
MFQGLRIFRINCYSIYSVFSDEALELTFFDPDQSPDSDGVQLAEADVRPDRPRAHREEPGRFVYVM